MRVLSVGSLFPPHHLGGYELVWASTVDAIRAAGHEVRVLTTDTRFPGAEDAGSGEADVRRALRWYWSDHRFPHLTLRERLELERHNARVFAEQLEDFAPDVINWWAMGGMSLSLVELARRRGLPAVGVVGDDWMDYGMRTDGWLRAMRRLPGPLRRLVARRTGLPTSVGLGTAALWLFNSERTLAHARASATGVDRVRVVHPGVDTSIFTPSTAPPEWAWKLVCAGRIDPRKGISTALKALAQLPAEATLNVLGPGDPGHLDHLRGAAAGLGIADRVSFGETTREGLADVLRASDALLFPVQWEEPWGLVPLEAMACGTPVVASATGGAREYLRDGENCVAYSPPGDARALAAAVSKLAADASLRARVRAGGLATADEHRAAAHDAAIVAALEEAARR